MTDPHANFAYSTVAVAPSPADSGTSLEVQSGDGAIFPATSPFKPFNVTVWPDGTRASVSNAEILRVTDVVGDTFTIERTQEDTQARSILVGDQIENTITARSFTDVEYVAQAYYNAAVSNGPCTIPSGVSTAGTWYLNGGIPLLDLTDPTKPAVKVDGDYTLFGSIQYWGTAQPGKYGQFSVQADIGDDLTSVFASSDRAPVELDPQSENLVSVPVSFMWGLTAGQQIGWFAKHNIGVDADFKFVGYLKRTTGVVVSTFDFS